MSRVSKALKILKKLNKHIFRHNAGYQTGGFGCPYDEGTRAANEISANDKLNMMAIVSKGRRPRRLPK